MRWGGSGTRDASLPEAAGGNDGPAASQLHRALVVCPSSPPALTPPALERCHILLTQASQEPADAQAVGAELCVRRQSQEHADYLELHRIIFQRAAERRTADASSWPLEIGESTVGAQTGSNDTNGAHLGRLDSSALATGTLEGGGGGKAGGRVASLVARRAGEVQGCSSGGRQRPRSSGRVGREQAEG